MTVAVIAVAMMTPTPGMVSQSSACLVCAVPGDQRPIQVLDPTLQVMDLRHKQPKSMPGYGRNASIAVITNDLNELRQIPDALSDNDPKLRKMAA